MCLDVVGIVVELVYMFVKVFDYVLDCVCIL